jgi:hypothetical protein
VPPDHVDAPGHPRATVKPRSGLTPLEAYGSTPASASRLLAAILALAASLALLSMPLPWHHLIIPAAPFRVVTGLSAASWLLFVAAISTAVAVRTAMAPPGFATSCAITLLAFCTTLGVYVDHFNWSAQAASLYATAYNGVGFCLGVATAGLIIAASIISWRARE